MSKAKLKLMQRAAQAQLKREQKEAAAKANLDKNRPIDIEELLTQSQVEKKVLQKSLEGKLKVFSTEKKDLEVVIDTITIDNNDETKPSTSQRKLPSQPIKTIIESSEDKGKIIKPEGSPNIGKGKHNIVRAAGNKDLPSSLTEEKNIPNLGNPSPDSTLETCTETSNLGK